MATVILLVLALYAVQLFLQETTLYRFDMRAIVGNRDHIPEPGVIAGRLGRAKDNLREALPAFIALALLSMVLRVDQGLALKGAWLFLVARVLYVPAYVSGVILLRSAVWLVSLAGLAMMVKAIILGAG
ncbi:MAPEG family protein [Tsuneonella mangrovi]|uniref:MAPEG family protein n=1 Tax=Tsuneonella mangrovi TaxID=1982042 RepID=UPI000BA1DBA8|nr:MAPEG family protein [Tsuneonella mangrovi]